MGMGHADAAIRLGYMKGVAGDPSTFKPSFYPDEYGWPKGF